MSCLVLAALGDVSVRRAGWLHRAVHYHKQHLLHDLQQLPPVQLEAWVERVPAAQLHDSAAWDYPSVARLLALVGRSAAAAPARRALRRALRPSPQTRRFISKHQSWKLFPSLGKDHANEIYYDLDEYYSSQSGEGGDGWNGGEDEAVVVLRNPVEARLPSARISVKLLREILEARALAGRVMPPTTRYTIPWIPMNKTSTSETEASGNMTTVASGANETVTTDAGITADTTVTTVTASGNTETVETSTATTGEESTTEGDATTI